jgi:hypothetical protein
MEWPGIMNTGTDPEDLRDELEIKLFTLLPQWFTLLPQLKALDSYVTETHPKIREEDRLAKLQKQLACLQTIMMMETLKKSAEAAAAAAKTQTTQTPFGNGKRAQPPKRPHEFVHAPFSP